MKKAYLVLDTSATMVDIWKIHNKTVMRNLRVKYNTPTTLRSFNSEHQDLPNVDGDIIIITDTFGDNWRNGSIFKSLKEHSGNVTLLTPIERHDRMFTMMHKCPVKQTDGKSIDVILIDGVTNRVADLTGYTEQRVITESSLIPIPTPTERSLDEKMSRFYSQCSGKGQLLAFHMSGVELTVANIDIVNQRMNIGATKDDIFQMLLTGLVDRIVVNHSNVYDFKAGVRSKLNANIAATTNMKVVELIEEYGYSKGTQHKELRKKAENRLGNRN